jgi:hypothetical protein
VGLDQQVRLCRRALEALPETMDGQPSLPIWTELLTLDELLSERP